MVCACGLRCFVWLVNLFCLVMIVMLVVLCCLLAMIVSDFVYYLLFMFDFVGCAFGVVFFLWMIFNFVVFGFVSLGEFCVLIVGLMLIIVLRF